MQIPALLPQFLHSCRISAGFPCSSLLHCRLSPRSGSVVTVHLSRPCTCCLGLHWRTCTSPGVLDRIAADNSPRRSTMTARCEGLRRSARIAQRSSSGEAACFADHTTIAYQRYAGRMPDRLVWPTGSELQWLLKGSDRIDAS